MLTALRVTEGPAPPGWTEPGASVTEAAVGRPGGSAACESIAQWVGSWSNGATPTGTPMAAATEATEQRCQQVRCSGRVEEKSTRRLQAQSAGGSLGRVQHSQFFQYHLLKRVCVPPCMLYLTLLKIPWLWICDFISGSDPPGAGGPLPPRWKPEAGPLLLLRGLRWFGITTVEKGNVTPGWV